LCNTQVDKEYPGREYSLVAACIAIVVLLSVSLLGRQSASVLHCAGAAMNRNGACFNVDGIPAASPLGGNGVPVGAPF
jgi:hypothetical protein